MSATAAHGGRVGKYEIITRLSVGGMAEVFLAVLVGPGGFRKFVVLKRILPQLRDDRSFVEMLLDEARITAALSHSGIAQVYDLGQDGGDLFLVMEFVAGQDLSSVRKTAASRGLSIPIGFTCRAVRDVCLALHYAHSFVDAGGAHAPVVHRDVSPRNLMVTYTGGVKIIDFGIAKAKGLLERTQYGMLKGSVGYMSPEQATAGGLDGRTDLFSAGVVLHELLTGTKLFRVSGDDRATIERVLAERIPAPHTINPKVPPELSLVVLRALERHRDARYATGKEMAHAIEGVAGADLFDDEMLAGFMRELFADKIETTRKLLTVETGSDRAGLVDADGLEHGGATGSRRNNEEATLSGAPASAGPKSPPISWSGLRITTAPPAQPAVILAVDDSNVGRKLVEMHLGKAGFHVITCSSAQEALEVLAEMRPDLILLDVLMPEMNGFELCTRIRESLDAKTPIVFVSAASSLEERTKGLDSGADDFVRKPYDPAELVARVRGQLRRVAAMKAEA
jgi:serine/threonine-protein kinase